VAAEIKRETGLDTKLLIGGSGEFTVWLGEKLIAEKKLGVFPETSAVIAAVKAATSSSAT